MTAPDYTLSMTAEWAEESDSYGDIDFRRSLVTGELADRIRERFGATDDVYFVEYEEEYGACHTCAGIDQMVRVECGDHRRTFTANEGIPLPALLRWLDEPRRLAEQDAAARARQAEQAANDHQFTSTVIGGITSAINDLEAEGYTSDQDWHDKLMSKLGVRGYGE
jgi:hypothetical protein